MKAELITRLIRAIASGATESLEPLARQVVEAERKLGHTRLANELQQILDKPRPRRKRSKGDAERGLSELPVSRRRSETLATDIPPEALQHHMVLPPEVEGRFKRIEREFAARERLGASGLRPRRTVLLYGPPGCGKSLGAQRLAWNTGLPLLKVKFDAILSSFFGESAANLRSLFEAAKARPCVLLLDECDFIARSRLGGKDIGEASRIVNSLLQLMEDYEAPGLLVATTNVESSLDEALFRRFDDAFLVPLPGPVEIEKLLRGSLASLAVDASVDWHALVQRLAGESAAMVVKAGNDAAKAVVLSGRRTIGSSDLEEAIDDLASHRAR